MLYLGVVIVSMTCSGYATCPLFWVRTESSIVQTRIRAAMVFCMEKLTKLGEIFLQHLQHGWPRPFFQGTLFWERVGLRGKARQNCPDASHLH
mmetsp:Transcript_67515/g.119738  ORF Transcript_67515/g.119738 Transcript_67515/m.119738 type:complete len:93 (+) Transcript_67515:1499-1777(+)